MSCGQRGAAGLLLLCSVQCSVTWSLACCCFRGCPCMTADLKKIWEVVNWKDCGRRYKEAIGE